MLDIFRRELLLADELEDAPGRAHDDVRRLVLENALVLRNRGASVEDRDLHIGKVAREARELVVDLVLSLIHI